MPEPPPDRAHDRQQAKVSGAIIPKSACSNQEGLRATPVEELAIETPRLRDERCARRRPSRGRCVDVGVSAVHALSDWLKLEIRRSGKVCYQEYSLGLPTTELRQPGTTQSSGRHGTENLAASWPRSGARTKARNAARGEGTA